MNNKPAINPDEPVGIDFLFQEDQAFTMQVLSLNSRAEQFEAIEKWLQENVKEPMKREIKIAEFKEYFDNLEEEFDRDDYLEDEEE